MKDSFFVIVNRARVVRIERTTGPGKRRKERPSSLHSDEYAIRLSITVPDAAFKARPIPAATLDVPEPAVIQPPEIRFEIDKVPADV